jgi:DNA polymerase III sliding clamp (beta) subunit (PCNA family)
MTQIQVLKDDMVKKLSNLKDDNVQIADVVIKRRPLLEALKLQTQENADVLTITYGQVAGYTSDTEPCVQISCDHTVMRFLNRPKTPKCGVFDPAVVKSFNFGEYHETKLSGIKINPQELLKAITFGMGSVATELSRPSLHCLYIECGNDVIKFTSADGYRLNTNSLPAKGIKQGNLLIELSDVSKIMTFLKSIKPHGKNKSKWYDDVYLSFTKKALTLAITGDSITVDSQDLTFPKYEQLIPSTGIKAEFISSELLQAVKSLRFVAKDSSNIIQLVFNKADNKITLTSKSEEIGDTTAECDVIVEADGRIAFNSRFLIEFLALCKDTRITGLFNQESDPMLFTVDNKQSVIMPMRVNEWAESNKATSEPNEINTDNLEDDIPEELAETVGV